VVDGRFGDCGSVLYEVKRAMRWDSKWLTKLATDPGEARPRYRSARLGCAAARRGVGFLDRRPGVWVVDFDEALR
jgi:hypothetical protein